MQAVRGPSAPGPDGEDGHPERRSAQPRRQVHPGILGALGHIAAPCVIHEDAPHHFRRHGEKLPATLPVGVLLVAARRRYASWTSAVGCRTCPGRSCRSRDAARRRSSRWTTASSWSRAAKSPRPHARSNTVASRSATVVAQSGYRANHPSAWSEGAVTPPEASGRPPVRRFFTFLAWTSSGGESVLTPRSLCRLTIPHMGQYVAIGCLGIGALGSVGCADGLGGPTNPQRWLVGGPRVPGRSRAGDLRIEDSGEYQGVAGRSARSRPPVEIGNRRRIVYASDLVFPQLDTDIVLDLPGPGDDKALATAHSISSPALGQCLSGGTGNCHAHPAIRERHAVAGKQRRGWGLNQACV